jgi:hypothetical protein
LSASLWTGPGLSLVTDAGSLEVNEAFSEDMTPSSFNTPDVDYSLRQKVLQCINWIRWIKRIRTRSVNMFTDHLPLPVADG